MTDRIFSHSPGKTKEKFPATCWTDISGWEKATLEQKKQSLANFFKNYRTPVMNFIISIGNSAYEAEDIFQEFVSRQMEGRIFIAADPGKGKFRNFLLASVKRFTIDRQRRSAALKRRPKGGMVHMESMICTDIKWADVLGTGHSPEEIYEASWLLTLLSNVAKRLESEFSQKGQKTHFQLFKKRVIDPILTTGDKPAVKSLAAEYNLTESAAGNYIVTAKRAYQRILRDEIRTYTGSEKEVTEEINDLFRFLKYFHT